MLPSARRSSDTRGSANIGSPAAEILPVAVLDGDQHAAALVMAEMIVRLHVEDAVHAGNLLHAFERVAHGLAEFGRARLRLLQSDRDRGNQKLARIPHVPAEGGDGPSAVLFLVELGVFECRGLRGVVVGKLRAGHQRADRHDRAFGRRTRHADEVPTGRAVRVVDLPLIAALGKRDVGERGRRAGRHHQDRLRVGGDELEHLTGHAGVRARETLDRIQRDAGFLEHRGDRLQPLFAIAVRVADEADVLYVVGLHVLEQRARHLGYVLRCTEGPGLDRGIDADWRERDHGGLRLGGHAGCRDRGRRRRRADDDVARVLGKALADVEGGVGRIGRVVEDDVVDLLAAGLGGQELDRIALRHTQRGGRAGGRNRHADVDVGKDGRGRCHQHGGRQGQSGLHCHTPPLVILHETTPCGRPLHPGIRSPTTSSR
jgi:hypothetical protein